MLTKNLYVATVFEKIFPSRFVVNMSDCGICILCQLLFIEIIGSVLLFTLSLLYPQGMNSCKSSSNLCCELLLIHYNLLSLSNSFPKRSRKPFLQKNSFKLVFRNNRVPNVVADAAMIATGIDHFIGRVCL